MPSELIKSDFSPRPDLISIYWGDGECSPCHFCSSGDLSRISRLLAARQNPVSEMENRMGGEKADQLQTGVFPAFKIALEGSLGNSGCLQYRIDAGLAISVQADDFGSPGGSVLLSLILACCQKQGMNSVCLSRKKKIESFFHAGAHLSGRVCVDFSIQEQYDNVELEIEWPLWTGDWIGRDIHIGLEGTCLTYPNLTY